MRPRRFGLADLTVEVLYVAVGVGLVADGFLFERVRTLDLREGSARFTDLEG